MKNMKSNAIGRITILLLFVLSAAAVQPFNGYAQTAAADSGFSMKKLASALGTQKSISDTGRVPLPKTPNLGATVVKMIIALAVILLLLGGITYGFKRFAFKGPRNISKSGLMDVLESMSFMPGKHLCLVRVSDRVLLLGVSPEDIHILCEFQGPKALEIIEATDKGNMPKLLTQFSDHLNGFLGKFKEKKEANG
jgi:flagellar biogenesis protein FliO